MVLIMVPYVAVVFMFVGSMIAGMINWFYVSLRGETSDIIFIACSNGSMRGHVATTKKKNSI